MLDREEELGHDDYWSVSKLATMGECGQKFWRRYVKRSHADEAKGAALKFGSAVHKCLELMHREGIWDDGQVQRLWADHWLPAIAEIDWDEEQTSPKVYGNRGLKMLEQYVPVHKDDVVLATEIKFRLKQPDKPDLGGVIDKITVRDGYPAVVDYKTSKYPPDPLVLRADHQLTMYYMAAKDLGFATDRLAIHNLLDGTEYWTTRDQSDVGRLWSAIRDAQLKVKHEMFERNVTNNCKFCSYKNVCLGGIGGQ